jgi:hypothetical protein
LILRTIAFGADMLAGAKPIPDLAAPRSQITLSGDIAPAPFVA